MSDHKEKILSLHSLIVNRINVIKEVCDEANIKYSDSILYMHLNSQKLIIDELIRSCFNDKRKFQEGQLRLCSTLSVAYQLL